MYLYISYTITQSTFVSKSTTTLTAVSEEAVNNPHKADAEITVKKSEDDDATGEALENNTLVIQQSFKILTYFM